MEEYTDSQSSMLLSSHHGLSGPDTTAQAMALGELVSRLTGDLVVTLGVQGDVLAVSQAGDPSGPQAGNGGWGQGWIGRPWIETVAGDCRNKATRMLADLSSQGHADRREMSHPTDDGHPVLRVWTAVRLGEGGPALALGHDLTPVRQQVEHLRSAQDQLEQSYWETQFGANDRP